MKYLLLIIVIAVFVSLPSQSYARDSHDSQGSEHTSIDGRVKDKNGHGSSHAQISVTCNGHTQRTTTDNNGNYHVSFDGKSCRDGDSVFTTSERHGRLGHGRGKVHKGKHDDEHESHVDCDEDDDPTESVPEFGLISGSLAALSSAGAYWKMRKVRT